MRDSVSVMSRQQRGGPRRRLYTAASLPLLLEKHYSEAIEAVVRFAQNTASRQRRDGLLPSARIDKARPIELANCSRANDTPCLRVV